jgi:hypothetical protein
MFKLPSQTCEHAVDLLFGRVACTGIALEIVNIQIEVVCVATPIIACLEARNMQKLFYLMVVGHLDEHN